MLRSRKLKFTAWLGFHLIHDLILGALGRWVTVPVEVLLALFIPISVSALFLSEWLEHTFKHRGEEE